MINRLKKYVQLTPLAHYMDSFFFNSILHQYEQHFPFDIISSYVEFNTFSISISNSAQYKGIALNAKEETIQGIGMVSMEFKEFHSFVLFK